MNLADEGIGVEGRFVVLRHETPPGDPRPTHWDFMLETAAGLRTWALESQPADGCWLAADGLPLHRAVYLTFEGPISGGRGTVTRWDEGRFRREPAGREPAGRERIVVQLAGGQLRGQAVLEEAPGAQRWRFFFTAEPT
ncbi:MAG TPA: DNA polymerase ligase N-terminal domain-containing protein [Pirellulales bacterium]|jgi:hypothetical protein